MGGKFSHGLLEKSPMITKNVPEFVACLFCDKLIPSGGSLDGQNRQSPIASDFGSQTQIAALFAVLLYRNV